jgi:hypothetical protein
MTEPIKLGNSGLSVPPATSPNSTGSCPATGGSCKVLLVATVLENLYYVPPDQLAATRS